MKQKLHPPVLMLGKGSEPYKQQLMDDGNYCYRIALLLSMRKGRSISDTGFIRIGPQWGKVEVHNTKRLPEGTVHHIGTNVEGSISQEAMM